jgi:hypothetical protein
LTNEKLIRKMEAKKITKTGGKTRKSPGRIAVPVNSGVKAARKELTEEENRGKANEIYLQRIERGEHGTDLTDWIEAEESLMDSIC